MSGESWLLFARWLFFFATAVVLIGDVLPVAGRAGLLLGVFFGYLLVVTLAVLGQRSEHPAYRYLTGAVDVLLLAAAAGLSGGSTSPLLAGLLFFACVAGLRAPRVAFAALYAALGTVLVVLFAWPRPLSEPAEIVRLLGLFTTPSLLLAMAFGPGFVHEAPTAVGLPMARVEQALALGGLLIHGQRETLGDELAARLSALFGAEIGGVLLTDPDVTRWRLFTSISGRRFEHEIHRDAVASGPIGAIVIGQRTLRLGPGDPRLQTRGLPEPHPTHLQNFLGVPLHGSTGAIGALYVADRDPDPFGPEDQALLEIVAGQAAPVFGQSAAPHQLVEAVLALARAAELADPQSAGHGERTARYAAAIARELRLSEAEMEQIALGAALHHVGYVAVPTHLLGKTEPLTPTELAQLQQHTRVGIRIIDSFNRSQMVLEAVYHHHERWDGRGYPNALAGEQIPLSARIVAVADVLDNLISGRHQRRPIRPREAIEEIVRASGTEFDPSVVQALLAAVRRHGEEYFAIQPEPAPAPASPGYRAA